MSTTYASAAREALPHALLAIDGFHVSQLANKAIGDTRRRVAHELRGRRGRATDPEYTIRGLLVRAEEKLSPAARGKLLCASPTSAGTPASRSAPPGARRNTCAPCSRSPRLAPASRPAAPTSTGP
ncbi:transposase [Frankia sp. Cas3]|uniref:transposase n=1 Tax=Frankia sp. Cas3 TaxID=3073926 RepID=UPI003A0FC173